MNEKLEKDLLDAFLKAANELADVSQAAEELLESGHHESPAMRRIIIGGLRQARKKVILTQGELVSCMANGKKS